MTDDGVAQFQPFWPAPPIRLELAQMESVTRCAWSENHEAGHFGSAMFIADLGGEKTTVAPMQTQSLYLDVHRRTPPVRDGHR